MAELYQAIEGRDDYGPMGVFFEWLPGKEQWVGMTRLGWPGGYKIHISINPAEDEKAAQKILPFLREGNKYHKIVASPPAYGRLNSGKSRGKFVTIYCGPNLHKFAELVGALDSFLLTQRFKPGPRPQEREGDRYIGDEPSIGLCGLLTYTVKEDYQD